MLDCPLKIHDSGMLVAVVIDVLRPVIDIDLPVVEHDRDSTPDIEVSASETVKGTE